LSRGLDYRNDEPNLGGAHHFPLQVRGMDCLLSHVSLQLHDVLENFSRLVFAKQAGLMRLGTEVNFVTHLSTFRAVGASGELYVQVLRVEPAS
jgi:hypothetical protein